MAKTRGVNTENLKSGMKVVGSERAELMVAPQGQWVDRIEPHLVNGKPTSGIMVYWQGHAQPEVFNPYWTWYVEVADGPMTNRAAVQPLMPTPEETLTKMVKDLDYEEAKAKWLDDRYKFVREKFEAFSKTEQWQKAATKYPRAVDDMRNQIEALFFEEFEAKTPHPTK